MKKTLWLISILLLITFLVGCSQQGELGSSDLETPNEEGKPESLTVVSGLAGGTWSPIGAAIADVFIKEGIKANSEPGGAVSNLINVSDGEADLGLTMTIMGPLAERGEEPFEDIYDNVAGIAVIFTNYAHVGVDAEAGVSSVTDLRGKVYANQPVGTGTQVVFDYILQAAGLTPEDLDVTYVSQSEGKELVKDRHAVGFTATTAAPASAYIELGATRPIDFLSFDDDFISKLSELNPGLVKKVIPAETYPGQSEDIVTVGSDTILVAPKDMTEEEAYWITKALVEGIETLRNGHSSMKNLTVEIMAGVEGVPLHPGAKKYFDEVL